MKDSEISSPAELDAALAGRAMSRREKLWKTAEGRAFRWWDVAVAVIGALLFLSGLYLVLFAQEIDGAMQLVLGILSSARRWFGTNNCRSKRCKSW